VVRALVIDVGSTSIRAGIVDATGTVSAVEQRRLTVSSPNPGEVELDAAEIGRLALELAARSLSAGGPCDVVGIANQRATTVVFDPATGAPVGPALGWQDLRTVIDCLILQGAGLRLAPNQSATKAKWLVEQSGRDARQLRFATLETYLARVLSEGALHVTDHSNAAVTGLVELGAGGWDEPTLAALGLDPLMMPRIVDTMGPLAPASALRGAPMITALVGDQSASLFGQSCVHPGAAKVTFGTGAMLDLVSGTASPATLTRLRSGCFPIVARSRDGELTWGIEGIVLSAGTCVDWLRDDLGLIADVADTEPLARSVESTDGVSFVPALLGLGTPEWDFGARGAFFGLTRGSRKAHLVRAVLEGVAQRGADLIEAAGLETGRALTEVRVDGGMTANRFLLQCLADFAGCAVAVSPEREATTRGAGLMALVAADAMTLEDVASLWNPRERYEPMIDSSQRDAARATWRDVVERAKATIPDLSSVSF
jgi:glycerol kinase